MRYQLNPNMLPPGSPPPEPGIPLRWKLFILISTAFFIVLAGLAAFWLPDYPVVAWALVLFSTHYAAFLLVQRVGCDADRPAP